eukprot:2882565-Prymnesium_polylepis.1
MDKYRPQPAARGPQIGQVHLGVQEEAQREAEGQVPGVDFDQTHCATMRASSLRVLCAVGASLGLRMRRWDFASAYLQGSLLDGEVIYCSPPPGYSHEDPDGNDRIGSDGQPQICRVEKPIYGMGQAGRRWQRSIFPWFVEQGFKPSHSDPCLFQRRETRQTPSGPREELLIIGVYIDDLFVLYSHDDQHSLFHAFTTAMQARWEVDDEGEVNDLLNVEITREGEDVVLRQRSYIEKMVGLFLTDEQRPNFQTSQTPCYEDIAQWVADALVQTEPPDAVLLKKYQCLVGALMYAATQTRPDIAYSVGMLAHAMGKPTPTLYGAALRVLMYLDKHKHVGLRYSRDHRKMYGMSDSDWAVNHSTSGQVFKYMTAAISWGSKKQPTIALSSCKAEIMAASEASKEAISLRSLLSDLGFGDDEPTRLHVDNQSAIAVAYNPEHHSRMKHVERRHFFVR